MTLRILIILAIIFVLAYVLLIELSGYNTIDTSDAPKPDVPAVMLGKD